MKTSGHEPVLLQECIEGLGADRGGRFLDTTFGGGGHSRAILEANPANHLTALDRDPAAGERAARFAEEFPGRFSFHKMDFGDLGSLEESDFDGILFDLGVSSFQLDEVDRGFSFRGDAPLDMRMDPTQGISAAEFLETASEDSLVEAIRDLGEEKFWRRIVGAILDARGTGKLSRTSTVADLIRSAVPAAAARGRLHPATRSFQGIRIAVNGELDAVRSALPAGFLKLAPEGRMAVISFHSLEDRIVKRFFRARAGRPVGANDSRPQEERTVEAKLPFTRPLRPTETEIQNNPRSRSSRLRVLVKIAVS
ncbi:16S rRNA (cytosine(1402)-N(4))-methyltransferase RsmH [Puniceicoccus vermicola]|uniref:Ribosomal RNA small subunit methyltransferase H n=1 Tax=Puniceicoccus vermicola TaxID=388746 RepID=A0A7X1E5T9_9BACT|nr:16S rRNA (cytosine(1402)-N(4))-methyltransferase RsmH [Puniceicoccus vermicola]MBC2603995.1 16S rRNA (cytosine(1402)-N(4))-methyltransferase RsmH [Puniceicoccus vermicola]